MTTRMRSYIAECVGTALLVFFAVGSAVFGIDGSGRWAWLWPSV